MLHTGADGTRYYLIPGIYAPPAIPGACKKFLPPSQRSPSQIGPHGPVATLEPFSSTESGGIPFTAAMIEAGAADLFEIPASGKTAPYYGLVPDGVASVTVSVAGGSSTTSAVTDNFFITQVSASPPGQPFMVTQQWYAPNGALIKTTSHTTTSGTFTGSFSG